MNEKIPFEREVITAVLLRAGYDISVLLSALESPNGKGITSKAWYQRFRNNTWTYGQKLECAKWVYGLTGFEVEI